MGVAVEHRGDLGRASDQVPAELLGPVLEAAGGTRDPESRHDVVVRAADRDGDAGEPDLELVDGHGIAASAGGGAVAIELRVGSPA